MPPFAVPASEYMSSPVLTVATTASSLEAEERIEDHGVTALGVTDEGGALVGVVSRTDLLKAASGEPGATFSLPDVPIAELMSTEPAKVEASTSLEEVAQTMLAGHIHRVFVEREGEVVGVLSTRDIMRAVFDERVRAPAIEIATRSVIDVMATDPIAVAVERLDAAGLHGLIVTDDGWPVGTFSQLDALLGRARDPRTPVEEVMELRMLVLPPETPLYRAARQALAMNVRRFVLNDGDDLVGVVSTFDFLRVPV